MPAEAGDDAIAVALVLHLQHHALVRLVDARRRLGDDAVEARALEAAEPVGGDGAVACRRREVERRLRRSASSCLERARGARANGAARRSRSPSHSRSKKTIDAGISLGEQLHARRGRVEAQLQRLEVERVAARDDDLAVEHAALGQLRLQRLEQLREVAVERLLVAALDEQLVAVAKDQRAEAVPLRLEDPAVAGGQLADALGEHRQDRRIAGQVHAEWYRRMPAPAS